MLEIEETRQTWAKKLHDLTRKSRHDAAAVQVLSGHLKHMICLPATVVSSFFLLHHLFNSQPLLFCRRKSHGGFQNERWILMVHCRSIHIHSLTFYVREIFLVDGVSSSTSEPANHSELLKGIKYFSQLLHTRHAPVTLTALSISISISLSQVDCWARSHLSIRAMMMEDPLSPSALVGTGTYQPRLED